MYIFEKLNTTNMIQRVQSVYLLLVTILMSFMLFSAYAEISLADGRNLTFQSYAITSSVGGKVMEAYRTTFLLVLLIMVTGLLSFLNIFLFSKRIIQMRLCLVSAALLGLMLIIMYVYYSGARHALDVDRHVFRLSAIFPVVSILLNLLAYRNIHSDELLVNSYNRIR